MNPVICDIKRATELAVQLLCDSWSYVGKRGLAIGGGCEFWNTVYVRNENEVVTFEFVRRNGFTTCRVDGLPVNCLIN